jgi:hypothetical protein
MKKFRLSLFHLSFRVVMLLLALAPLVLQVVWMRPAGLFLWIVESVTGSWCVLGFIVALTDARRAWRDRYDAAVDVFE